MCYTFIYSLLKLQITLIIITILQDYTRIRIERERGTHSYVDNLPNHIVEIFLILFSFLIAPKLQQKQARVNAPSLQSGTRSQRLPMPRHRSLSLSSNCQSDTLTQQPPTTTSAASTTKLQQDVRIFLFSFFVWVLMILIFFCFFLMPLSASVASSS